MTIRDLYPDIKPSLNLDFANTKSLDPRVDFDRSTSGTYYDGQTFAKAEENLFKYSQQFDNAVWNGFNATLTSNTEVAPDGTTTAYSITRDSGSGVSYINAGAYLNSINLELGRNYVTSVYAKADTASFFWIEFFDQSDNKIAYYDLVNGVVDGAQGGATASIEDAGNGWYRCIHNYTPQDNRDLNFGPASSGFSGSNTNARTLNAGDGVFIWGAQLEERSQVTAYTSTTDQPISNYIPVLKTASPNEPRFDHDPVTGESKGLLIEEQRTNLIEQSQNFFNSYWLVDSTRIILNESDVITAPDGTKTAAKIVATDVETDHFLATGPNDVFFESGKSYTLSVFVKPNDFSKVAINVGASRFFGTFDLSSQQVMRTDGSRFDNTSGRIEQFENGWFRVSISGTANTTDSRYVRVAPTTSNDDPSGSSFIGDNFSGIFVWGVQFEEGSFPTSYIKTEGSQVTRVADSASITGDNFSEWYRQDEGSFDIDVGSYQVGEKLPGIFTVRNSSTGFSDWIRVNENDDNCTFQIRVNGSDTAVIQTTTSLFNKVAVTYATNNSVSSVDGSSENTDTNCIIPTGIDELLIGDYASNPKEINGHIKRLTYYPKRLPKAVLQALTKD